MPLLMIVVVSFFVFILCLIGAQSCFFTRRWLLFWAAVVCVVASGLCIFNELSQWLLPPSSEMHIVVRQPTTPL